MLLLAMSHEWLALFHPISQKGKGKQDLNQHFSNGREDSDNGCLRPICLSKDRTEKAFARRQPAPTPLKRAEGLTPVVLLKETHYQPELKQGK